MTNAHSARRWFEAEGGAGSTSARHFVGSDHQPGGGRCLRHPHHLRVLGLGGRALLAVVGHRPADRHRHRRGRLSRPAGRRACDGPAFRRRAAGEQPAGALGLLDVWYRNFHGFTSRSIAPYHSALRRLPAYLQQLEMESNGKRVDLAGAAAALWHLARAVGRAGHQWPACLLPDAAPGHRRGAGRVHRVVKRRHDLAGAPAAMLLANALAQAQALMQGKRRSPVATKDFPGNRPSTFLLLDDLTPASLGALIALHEHRVFVSGVAVGHQQLRPVGCGAGQGAGQGHRAAPGQR